MRTSKSKAVRNGLDSLERFITASMCPRHESCDHETGDRTGDRVSRIVTSGSDTKSSCENDHDQSDQDS